MESAIAQQKPSQVKTATTLLWVSLGIGLLNFALQFGYLRTQASVSFIVLVAAITFAIMVLLVYLVSTGRNWARITFLILFLLGIVTGGPELLPTFQRSALVGSLSLAQWVLQIIALYLLFAKPGASWFGKRTKG